MWDDFAERDVNTYSLDHLSDFYVRMTRPPVTRLASDAQHATFVRSAERVVVAYLGASEDDDSGALWTAVHHKHGPNAGLAAVYAHVASLLRSEFRFGVLREADFAGASLGAILTSVHQQHDHQAAAVAQGTLDCSSEPAGASSMSCDEDEAGDPTLIERFAAAVASSSWPQLVFFTNHAGHDHEPIVLPASGRSSASDVRSFLEQHAHAPFGEINATNYVHFESMGLPLVHVFVDEDNAAMMQDARDVFVPLARKFRGRLSFGYFCAKTYKAHARSIGLTSMKRLPAVSVENHATRRHFVMPPSLSVKRHSTRRIWAFLQSVLDGAVQPTVISAREPSKREQEANAPVTELVGSTIEAFLALQPRSSDAIVLFYAPWCGVCRNTLKSFKTLASLFQSSGESRVRFGQMDFTENDIPFGQGNRMVLETPTIYYFPRGNTSRAVIFETDDPPHVMTILRDFIVGQASFPLDAAKLRTPHDEAHAEHLRHVHESHVPRRPVRRSTSEARDEL